MWWKTLTPAQVLGYDYKQGVTSHGLQYGISSALLPLDAMVLNSEFDQYCAEFMSMRQLDAFAVMTLCSSPSEEKQRQLMLVASTQEKLEALETVFLDMGGDLQLSPLLMETGEGGECFKSCFMQGDVTKSRKQVMPLFHSAVSLLKQDEQYMKYQCSWEEFKTCLIKFEVYIITLQSEPGTWASAFILLMIKAQWFWSFYSICLALGVRVVGHTTTCMAVGCGWWWPWCAVLLFAFLRCWLVGQYNELLVLLSLSLTIDRAFVICHLPLAFSGIMIM